MRIKRIYKLFPKLWYLKRLYKGRGLRALSTEQVFTQIYRDNIWRDPESRSGPGSSLDETAVLRQALESLIGRYQIDSLLDIPCGDMNWIQHLKSNIREYIGADIVEELIEENRKKHTSEIHRFQKLDLLTDELPKADLVLCRDCLIHFDFEGIFKALRNLKRSGSEYLLTTNYTKLDKNLNIVTGQWRPINLTLPPFSLPGPIEILDEQTPSGDARFYGKSLGFWPLTDVEI